MNLFKRFQKPQEMLRGEVAFKDGNEMTKDPLDLKKKVKSLGETNTFCVYNVPKH